VRLRAGVAITAGAVLVLAFGVAGLTFAAMQVHEQQGLVRFCFAEWCMQPGAAAVEGGATLVVVTVSSTARSVVQRPDHPQAWLTDSRGLSWGGPQPDLDRELAPGSSYSARLRFASAVAGCADLVVGEGAWPAFLGLGYAPSLFTERAGWRLCV
jgi:hypothetical protein